MTLWKNQNDMVDDGWYKQYESFFMKSDVFLFLKSYSFFALHSTEPEFFINAGLYIYGGFFSRGVRQFFISFFLAWIRMVSWIFFLKKTMFFFSDGLFWSVFFISHWVEYSFKTFFVNYVFSLVESSGFFRTVSFINGIFL